MTTWVLPILAAVLGYLGHWAQQVYAHRHDRRTSDRERMLSICDRLRLLRHYDQEAYELGGDDELDAVEHDASLLYHAKLRERVRYDCKRAAEWRMLGDSATREEVWGTYFGDAIECLTAAARGDKLPEMDDPTAWLDMQAEHQMANVMTPEGYAVTLLDRGIDPDFEELAYEEWRRHRHARRGWRRVMPQRSARSSAAR
ncbi:hypothetical protein ACFYRJ_00530 [Streptomyces sp. NPDC005531]|uniref:hypothetical protein n=1 Tax=Streptomyces sp. NPDC005531 TaxID=3364722 RepID=UPI0036D0454A